MTMPMPAGIPNMAQIAPIATADAGAQSAQAAQNAIAAQLPGIQQAVDQNIQAATPDMSGIVMNPGQPPQDMFQPSTTAPQA